MNKDHETERNIGPRKAGPALEATHRPHSRLAEAELRKIPRATVAAEAKPSFNGAAAGLRERTKRRKQTLAEVLSREGRDER